MEYLYRKTLLSQRKFTSLVLYLPFKENIKRKTAKEKKMILCRKAVKSEDGTVETLWSLPEDQANTLLTFAINVLLAKGVVEIQDIPYSEVLEKYDVPNKNPSAVQGDLFVEHSNK